MRKKDRETEIKENYEAFKEMLPELLENFRDKFALMHDKKVVATYSTAQEAAQTGNLLYKDDLYSVQKITDVPVDLGFFSRFHISGA